MIKHIEIQKQLNIQPYYVLTLEYTVGDADGDTEESIQINPNNSEIIEIFCKILDKLEPLEGNCVVSFDDNIFDHVKEGQITKDEGEIFTILTKITIKKSILNGENYEKYKNYKGMFGNLINREYCGTYTTYDEYNLVYFDQNGVMLSTIFE